jgi:methyl-accepting chemotaxis protein
MITVDAEATTRAAPTAPAAETQELLETLEASSDALDQVHSAIDAFIERDTSSITGIIATETQQSLMLVLGLCGICLLLVLLAVWMLRRQIVAPVRTLSAATMTVAQGVLDHVIRVTSTDEIGQLQRDFNTMVTTIQQDRYSHRGRRYPQHLTGWYQLYAQACLTRATSY